MKSGCQEASTSWVNPGSVRSVDVRMQPPATSLRSSTQTLQPSRASSAAPTSELIPEPTKTASKVAIGAMLQNRFRLDMSRVRCATNRGMLLREVEYARPATVEEAISLLSEHDGARALAGGQTLVNVMKARAASPDVLVDLADLAELKTISFSADQSALELGAMVTNTQLIASSEVEVARPILAEVAATIADVQIRNRGTIGGNVCVNDPTNHFPPLLVALGASFTIRGTAGERTVSAEEFFLGVYLTAVGEGELLTKISVPTRKPGDGRRDGRRHARRARHLHRQRRRDGRGGRRAHRDRLRLGRARARHRDGGAPVGRRLLRGGRPGRGGRVSATTLDPPSDVHAGADYRRHLAEVSAVRAVLQAAERAKG